MDVVALTHLRRWWWRRNSAEGMILVSRRRRKVPVDNASSPAAVLTAASTKTGAAASDQSKNDKEEDEEGDEGDDADDAVNKIKDDINIIIKIAENVGSLAHRLIAIKTSVVRVADASIHHIRGCTMFAVPSGRGLAILKGGVLTDADIEAHVNTSFHADGENSEIKSVVPVLPEFISREFERQRFVVLVRLAEVTPLVDTTTENRGLLERILVRSANNLNGNSITLEERNAEHASVIDGLHVSLARVKSSHDITEIEILLPLLHHGEGLLGKLVLITTKLVEPLFCLLNVGVIRVFSAHHFGELDKVGMVLLLIMMVVVMMMMVMMIVEVGEVAAILWSHLCKCSDGKESQNQQTHDLLVHRNNV